MSAVVVSFAGGGKCPGKGWSRLRTSLRVSAVSRSSSTGIDKSHCRKAVCMEYRRDSLRCCSMDAATAAAAADKLIDE